jgi:hypothetical protein
MLRKTRGLEAAEQLREKDPFVAFEGLKQQWINVIQNALEPYSARAVTALNTVADALADVANKVKTDPLAGAAAAPAGIAGAGALAGLAGMSATALGWPTVGALLSSVGGAGLMFGWHMAGRQVRTELLADAEKQRAVRDARQDYTFANVGRFRSSAAAPDYRGLFDVPAAAPGRFPNLPSFKAPIEPFDLSGTAASAMDSFNAVLRAKGEESKAIGANIASALKSLLSFTATPTVTPTIAPGGAAPAAPAGSAAPSAPGRSSGGNVYEGGVYQIAEHRAEYFVPGQDGTILPGTGGGDGARATVAPSISTTIGDLHFHGISDVGEVASAVRAMLDQQVGNSVRGIFAFYGVVVA